MNEYSFISLDTLQGLQKEGLAMTKRQIDWINSKLERAESSGFTNDSKEQILAQSKSLLNG